MSWPVCTCARLVIAKALAPPPLGSTARTKCDVLEPEEKPGLNMSTGIFCRGRSRKRSTSAEANARLLLSQVTPMDSRNLRTVARYRSVLHSDS